jgi:hypothetical protein
MKTGLIWNNSRKNGDLGTTPTEIPVSLPNDVSKIVFCVGVDRSLHQR